MGSCPPAVAKDAVGLNLDQMMQAKDKSVSGLTGGIEHLFKKNKVDYIKGFGKLSSANTVRCRASASVGARW